jgi:peptidoglycan biosynthesis protein MviN/MurJ (putative lipid II flippase)
MRALYARSLPSSAVHVTIFTVCANLAGGLALMGRFSYRGLAAGTSIAFTGAALFGAWRLSRDMKTRIKLFEIPWLLRLVFSCSVMCAALIFFMKLFPYPPDSKLAVRALWGSFMVVFGCGIYVAVTTVLRCPEWTWIKTALLRGNKLHREV